MTTRITFNMTSDETLRIVDEYCHTHKLSRSKVIDALLSATAPVLNDINCYYQLARQTAVTLIKWSVSTGSSPQTQCRQCREVLSGDLGKQTFHQKNPGV